MTPADFRNWRLRLGLTQAELASRLGRCRSGISKIEQGRFGDVDRVMVLAMRALEAGLDGEALAAPPGHVMVAVPIEALESAAASDARFIADWRKWQARTAERMTRSAANPEGDPQP